MENNQEYQIVENPETTETQTPTIQFNTPVTENTTQDAVANELVENAFQQAVVHEVTNNTTVQEQLLSGAQQVINNRVDEIRSEADTQSKKAYFNNKKGACECFGYNEDTTEKWAVSVMNGWHNIMTGFWIVIGAVTFAPITFVAKKIKVILKASWVAILVAVIIYLATVSSPIWARYFAEWLESIINI